LERQKAKGRASDRRGGVEPEEVVRPLCQNYTKSYTIKKMTIDGFIGVLTGCFMMYFIMRHKNKSQKK
jgi:hypothetical protein